MSNTSSPTIDTYIHELFLPGDAVLEAALQHAHESGLRSIQVPAELGRLLGILARAIGARRILEIGTLGGYSAIHLARALPRDGRLISLEIDPHHAEVARENIEHAGLADRAEVRLGRGLDLLTQLINEHPFDLAFIDADKQTYPDYLAWCLRLVRPGGLIVADNVLSGGRVIASPPADEGALAIDAMNRAAGSDPRLDAMILPIRGGRDGILVAVIRNTAQ